MAMPAFSISFDLIETLRYDPDDGLFALDRHLDRLHASGDALGFGIDGHAIANELQVACFRCRQPARARLRISPTGTLAVELAPRPANPRGALIKVVPLPVAPDDWRLRHKTSDRAFYDRARTQAGTFEVAFVGPDGFLTEGSFTNLFVADASGVLRTPPLAHGLLPGVLRASLLADGTAIEAPLRPRDLRAPFFVGNALRGLIPARLA